MPMTGMSMSEHGWPGAYAAFVAQWVGMMAAMMLPSLLPRLWDYGRGVRRAGGVPAAALVTLAAVGYLAVWAGIGALIYPMTVAIAAAATVPVLAAMLPALAGAVVMAAGAVQFTSWKARHLQCWQSRVAPAASAPCSTGAAWRYGTRLGVHCAYCGAGLTAAMTVLGAMDLRVMAAATAIVTVERLVPGGLRIVRSLGAVGVAAGLLMIARVVAAG